MPKVAPFYSVNEANKPAHEHRVYHDNSACASGRDIPANERRQGTNNYDRCENCARMEQQGR